MHKGVRKELAGPPCTFPQCTTGLAGLGRGGQPPGKPARGSSRSRGLHFVGQALLFVGRFGLQQVQRNGKLSTIRHNNGVSVLLVFFGPGGARRSSGKHARGG